MKKHSSLRSEANRPFGQISIAGMACLGLTTFGNKTGLKETMLILEVDDHLQAVERIKESGGRVLGISEPYEGAPVYNVKTVDTENNQITISKTVSH